MRPRAGDRFVTVYHPIAGWKAVMYWFNPEAGGFWEPWDTSPVAFDTRKEAVNWAVIWGKNEGVEVRIPAEGEGEAPEDVCGG